MEDYITNFAKRGFGVLGFWGFGDSLVIKPDIAGVPGKQNIFGVVGKLVPLYFCLLRLAIDITK